jgi:hypothetical protein
MAENEEPELRAEPALNPMRKRLFAGASLIAHPTQLSPYRGLSMQMDIR